MKKFTMALLIALFAVSGLFADVIVVSEDISENTTWTSENEYHLDGLIFVDAGATLTIQAGTVIKGLESSNITTGDGASALIVRRGAKIMADGRADAPIIFTSEFDDVNDPADLLPGDRGLWGGIILLGNATTNQPTQDNQIEGIPANENALYGGNDDNDNSGVLRYVSIRHGGFSISGVPGDEINGLTMGAVGRGTTIEFIEVFANFDDGYEWFGGTVNSKNLVAAFCGDDAYDYDQGFRGKGQFWFSIQGTDEAGRGGEHDGGDDDETGTPYSRPTIWNATYIGSGSSVTPAPGGDGNNHALIFRDNAGGSYTNSIFTEFTGDGVTIEDIDIEDSRSKLENGLLQLNSNIWWDFGAGTALEDIVPQAFVRNAAAFNNNQLVNPLLISVSRQADGGLDPRPVVGSPAAGADLMPPSDGFFMAADFYGAFEPGTKPWIADWTALDQNGIFQETTTGQTVTVSDDISENTVWTAGNVYMLDGLIFVDSGASLTIEAGTVVKGLETSNITTGDGASALIVRRGGKLFAVGTADAPIIFTSEYDDVTDPADLTTTDRGLWGGVILLGKATTNQPTQDNQIEGIPANENALYGGTDDEDCSGMLKYISIRHGGFSISGVPGDEINGLTMGAVGSKTVIEYVEVFANFDDGFEWFGGTVNSKNLIAAFCGDDAYDYDQGFRGKGQFWLALQGTDEAGRGGEHDGGDDDETGTPYSTPEIWNVTYVGSGSALSPAPGGDGNNHALIFRDNAGGAYYNSIFTAYTGDGVAIEDIDIEDSRAKLENGLLSLGHNIWYDFGAGTTLDAIVPQAFVRNAAGFFNNQIVDPQLAGISRETDGGFDPRPNAQGSANGADILPDPNESFFAQADYKGAFDPYAIPWIDTWSALDHYGVYGEPQAGMDVMVTEDITANTTWYAQNTYMLDGLIFVNAGATLTIQAGTVIKGLESNNITTGDGASALIVRRGGKIMASGTADMPIIFTSEYDDLNDPIDLGPTDRGLWGGVILLGKATTNQPTQDNQIEGIPANENALFGGNDDNDNSGVLRYVSIRHGGFSISGVPGDEINGLTMGAVGSGTRIEFVEVYANFDDGFEWFGGTVNTKNLIAAFCGDDSYDYDQGFRGKGQFWFSIQGTDEAGRGGEHDGGDDDETGTPYSTPEIWNVTYIGSGSALSPAPGGDGNNHALIFRDNAGGSYTNSIFTAFTGDGIAVEDITIEDSRAKLENGLLALDNNIWWDFGAGTALSDIVPQEFVRTAAAFSNNQIVDPQIAQIGRDVNSGLNPIPDTNGPAAMVTVYPDDSFFTQADYKGAFNPTCTAPWFMGWSALDHEKITDSETAVEKEIADNKTLPDDYQLDQNYPNPFNPSTTIRYAVPVNGMVRLTVFNQLGQEIETLVQSVKSAGSYTISWDATDVPTGLYFYRLQAGETVLVKKMMLVK
jgi:hypothetical protein